MMRSPRFVGVAVRKPNQKIAIHVSPYQGLTERIPLLKRPILRGVVTLIESMVQGIEALSYSAQISTEGEESERLSNWAIAGSILSAFLLGMGLFVALPHFLTALVGSSRYFPMGAESPVFHVTDGLLKMAILLGYVYGISWIKEIRRVFQYHGAEHKAIYAFEAGEELSVENARRHTRLHPRCGTSFLLFLVLISIGVFSVFFPLFGWTDITSNSVLNHAWMVIIKIGLMLPVAGLSYEFIKLCACRMNNPLFRALIWPGLVLQNLTTREPDDGQLEVALASLRQVLRMEKSFSAPEVEREFEIAYLSELGRVQATAAEFPEL